jgi:molybdenum-dependent DNA-binding transcriptional regulator ModE
MNEELKAGTRLQLIQEAGKHAGNVPYKEKAEYILNMAKEFEKFVIGEEKGGQPKKTHICST